MRASRLESERFTSCATAGSPPLAVCRRELVRAPAATPARKIATRGTKSSGLDIGDSLIILLRICLQVLRLVSMVLGTYRVCRSLARLSFYLGKILPRRRRLVVPRLGIRYCRMGQSRISPFSGVRR